MAIKQFALPLDSNSNESGDITFQALVNANTSADFELTNVSAGGTTSLLNLITKKNGSTTSHTFSVTVLNGTAKVTLSASQLSTVYNDASGGNWDYVEAEWTLNAVDTPSPSIMMEIQSGKVYNRHGWPPSA